MTNIKFFRKDVAPSNPQEGYIWFNSANNTIQLYKNSAWEVYTGKINNVTYADGKLTIVPHVGDSTTIDLGSIGNIADLSNRLSTLETNFNKLSGEFTTVKTTVNTTSTAVATIINQLKDIAAEEKAVKTYVDTKMSDHETAREATDAVFTNRIGELETTTGIHTTEISNLKGLVGTTAVATQISNAINALDNGTNGVSDTGEKVTVTVKQEDGKVTSVIVSESDIASAQTLANLSTTVTNNKIAVEEALGGTYSKTNTVAAAIKAAADAAAAAQADIDAWNSATTNTDGVIETIVELNQYITEHTNAFTGLSGRVGNNETAISILNDKVDVTKVSTAINAAKTEAINAAASDAATKANNAKSGAISEAELYTDTQVNNLANGAVNTNTTDIATIKGHITTIKGDIETINTTIEENELTVASALTDLDERVTALSSGTVSSVSGEGYISATTTDGVVVVTATTGAVANGVNALALASDVKTYVDNA